jgi:ABC-type lipoprotein export system ATPase subunit
MSGIEAINIVKTFGPNTPQILKGINLVIPSGSFCTITGRSGSGKSTLLYILSTLDEATSGKVIINGIDLSQLNQKEQHRFRNQTMGFVFQFHHLLPELTTLENVLLPALKAGLIHEKKEFAKQLLIDVGLTGKENRLPQHLSGGEQQRVAIARALVMEPKYIFADEPTGNLDSVNGQAVMNLFKRFNQERGTSVIYVTHDQVWAEMATLKISLVDGALEAES